MMCANKITKKKINHAGLKLKVGKLEDNFICMYNTVMEVYKREGNQCKET